jgi:hypothetical protein
MTRLLITTMVLAAGVAHAEGFERLSEGAPAYAAVRPLSLSAALKRLGVDQMPEIQSLKQQLGGIDPLEPALLAPTGLDVAAPLVASVFETASPKPLMHHHRVVAQLRDPAMFSVFLAGVAASKQAPVTAVSADSPLGKLGVIASVESTEVNAVVRLASNEAIIDAVSPEDGKGMPPIAIARRWPVAVKTAFKAERGARRMFSPDAGVVLYVDGRKLLPLLDSLDKNNRGLKNGSPCRATWSKAPTTFDDVALALAIDPDGLTFSAAWGTQAGVPLGGLKFKTIDDRAFDVELLGRTAPAMMAAYAASLKPFEALKRGAPMNSSDTLVQSAMRCGAPAWGTLAVRAWPNAIGALLSGAKSGSSKPLAPSPGAMLSTFGNLRTVVLALRDANAQGIKWALGATLDASAKTMIETLLTVAAAGKGSTTLALGGRSPNVYRIEIEGQPASAAVESLAAGPMAFTLADSDDSIGWAYRSATRMPNAAPPPLPGPLPLVVARFDTPALARLSPLLKLGSQADAFFDRLAKLRRLDADVIADGDLFRVSVRAPVK